LASRAGDHFVLTFWFLFGQAKRDVLKIFPQENHVTSSGVETRDKDRGLIFPKKKDIMAFSKSYIQQHRLCRQLSSEAAGGPGETRCGVALRVSNRFALTFWFLFCQEKRRQMSGGHLSEPARKQPNAQFI